VEDTKVRSREQLLAAMGAASEKDLSTGQKSLLDSFTHGQSSAMRERLKFAEICKPQDVQNSKIGVALYDTTFLSGVPSDTVRKDFWPRASRPITLSSHWGQTQATTDSKSLLTHEVSHAIDNQRLTETQPYGFDGKHWGQEIIKPGAAFMEGGANFNEFLDFPSTARDNPYSYFSREVVKSDGSNGWEYVDPKEMTGNDFLQVELVVAQILFKIATTIPNGKGKILDQFAEGNKGCTLWMRQRLTYACPYSLGRIFVPPREPSNSKSG